MYKQQIGNTRDYGVTSNYESVQHCYNVEDRGWVGHYTIIDLMIHCVFAVKEQI